MCMAMGSSTGPRRAYQGLHSQRKVSSAARSSSAGNRAPEGPPRPMLEFLALLILYRSCVGNRSYWEFIGVIVISCPEESISEHSSTSSDSYILILLFPPCSQSIRGHRVITDISSMAEHSQSLILRTLNSNDIN